MNGIIIGGILFFALLVGLAISWFSIAEIIRVRRTPATWISALPSGGKVEIGGAVGEKTILSPIIHTACAVYKVEIQELERSRKGSHWSTVKEVRSDEPFELIDETGSIEVHPLGSDILVGLARETDALSSDQIAAIQDMGIATTGVFGSEIKFKVKEYVIRPQQEIYVLGHIQQNLDGKTYIGASDGPFIISDQNEQLTLRALYGQVIRNTLICLGIGLLIVIILARSI